MGFRLVDILDEWGRRHGEAPALAQGDEELSYSELGHRSGQVAAGLRALHVGEGARVVWIGANHPVFFELLFGAAKLRGAVVPLNTRLPPEELLAIVDDAQADLVVLGHDFSQLREQFSPHATLVVGEDYERWREEHDPAEVPVAEGSDSDVVVQLYTSGTTGTPKGVMLSNTNFALLTNVSNSWSMDHDSVAMVAMPVFHIAGCGFALVALAAGAKCILVAEVDPPAMLDQLERERVTNAFLVPAVLQFLTQVPGCEDRDYSALRSIAYGASPITSTALQRALEIFQTPLFQVYGLTETTGAVTQLDPEDHDPEGPRAHLMRSAGKPYDWVDLQIVHPEDFTPCVPGEVGEIWVRSPQVTQGYWKRPEESERALRPEGWFRSGDAGYLDEQGYLFVTDRIKDMVITGGENVYPVEVEEVLARHPHVRDVAVIGVPDERWGEVVTAVVVLSDGGAVDEQELMAWARERMAGFKRPRAVRFVAELPRSATGKVLKRQLRQD